MGPWLVLGSAGEVTYNIQRREKDKMQVVHVDRLARYYPDFGVELTSWLTDDLLPKAKSSQTEPITRTSAADVFEDGGKWGQSPCPRPRYRPRYQQTWRYSQRWNKAPRHADRADQSVYVYRHDIDGWPRAPLH